MEEETKTRKRLILNVEPEIHQKIKIQAAKRNMTMSKYILQCLIWRLQGEK